MKKIIYITVILSLILFSGCSGFNTHNGVGKYATDLPLYFTYTGVSVKNDQNRIYKIVKDKYGWLYYCTDIEGDLSLVLDNDGNSTKDISIVSE